MEYMRKKGKVHTFFFLFGLKQAKKIVQESLEAPHPKFVKYSPFCYKKNVKALLCCILQFVFFLFLFIKVSLEPQFLLHIVHRCFPCQWSYSQCPVLILYFVYAMLCTYATVCHSEYCREGRFVMRFSRFLKTRMM